uniref:Nuclear hormone receptor family member nhr-35 n=1 Tax=Parascaris univalens TaxID=6257 RepID=A0A915BGI0_PARUN
QDRADGNELLCVVCGDQATGKHYGTIACNGCKGFFRRTIRRSYKYTCRFNGNCNIDKHNRAVCRACRYMRCINAGMKVDAVQNERDIIGKRHRAASASSAPGSLHNAGGIAVSAAKISNTPRQSLVRRLSCHYSPPSTSSSSSSGWETPKSLLESLLLSEETIQGLRDTVIRQTGGVEYSSKKELPIQTSDGGRKATVNDIFLSIHSQLLLAIEWAKTLPPFAALSTDDQTALLKSFACQHVVLCVSYRSKNSCDSLKLINDSCIPRFRESENNHFPENFYLRDCERVMDQLVAPMRFLRMDDVEFVAMKACILFNPVAKGLSSGSVMHVLSTRRRIFAALEHYLDTKIPSDASRLGDLTFFILSPLQTLANMISEDILVSKLSGVAHLDQLMEELILSDTDEQKILPNRFQNGQLFKESIELAASRELSHSSSNISYLQSAAVMQQQTVTSSMPASPEAAAHTPLADFNGASPVHTFNKFAPSTTLSSYVLGPLNGSQPPSPGLELLNSLIEPTSSYQNNWSVSTQLTAFGTNSDPIFVSSALNL